MPPGLTRAGGAAHGCGHRVGPRAQPARHGRRGGQGGAAGAARRDCGAQGPAAGGRPAAGEGGTRTPRPAAACRRRSHAGVCSRTPARALRMLPPGALRTACCRCTPSRPPTDAHNPSLPCSSPPVPPPPGQVVDSEERAQVISRARTQNAEFHRRASVARMLAEQRRASEGGEAEGPGQGLHRTLHLVIKADVQGSAEAVRQAVAHMSTEHVRVQVGPRWFACCLLCVREREIVYLWRGRWRARAGPAACFPCASRQERRRGRSEESPPLAATSPHTGCWPACPALQVVHVGVGPVSQSDVQLAVPLGAKILGFNVRTAAADVDALAKQHGIEVRQAARVRAACRSGHVPGCSEGWSGGCHVELPMPLLLPAPELPAPSLPPCLPACLPAAIAGALSARDLRPAGGCGQPAGGRLSQGGARGGGGHRRGAAGLPAQGQQVGWAGLAGLRHLAGLGYHTVVVPPPCCLSEGKGTCGTQTVGKRRLCSTPGCWRHADYQPRLPSPCAGARRRAWLRGAAWQRAPSRHPSSIACCAGEWTSSAQLTLAAGGWWLAGAAARPCIGRTRLVACLGSSLAATASSPRLPRPRSCA